METNTNPKKIKELLSRGVEEVIDRSHLKKKLLSGKPLRVKHGVDPTTKDLHLGHAAIYERLRSFQELGHKVIFLIGDFTGRFGDPTQKGKTRRLRKKQEVKDLAKNYIDQAGTILDLDRLEIRYNSEWYDKMPSEKLLTLMSEFTVSQMLERDMFQKRMDQGLKIQLHEPIYPVLQAYDSVMLEADLEVGGKDQLFNLLKGRKLQKELGQEPQDILTTEILIGTDGEKKMSQSFQNYIGLEESAQQQFGKIMSIPDHLIISYFKLVTRVPLKQIQKIKESLKQKKMNPRGAKQRLAREIVTIYHGKKAAQQAQKEFEKVFQKGELPSRIPEIKVGFSSIDILDLLVKAGLTSSKSQAKRLIQQGGVKIDQKECSDWQRTVEIKEKGTVIQVGKRKFVRVVPR